MPSAATQMDTEVVILSEVPEGEISHDTPYMWDTKEMIQMNLQNRKRLKTQRMNLYGC